MRVEMVNISDTKMSFVPDIFLEIGPPFSKGLDDRLPPPPPLLSHGLEPALPVNKKVHPIINPPGYKLPL